MDLQCAGSAETSRGGLSGGAWQRAFTLNWIERIAPILAFGKPVLFEAQMRVPFIQEGLSLQGISHAHIIFVECDDQTRDARLVHDRQQPELANENIKDGAVICTERLSRLVASVRTSAGTKTSFSLIDAAVYARNDTGHCPAA